MSTSNLIRWGGLVVLLGGFLWGMQKIGWQLFIGNQDMLAYPQPAATILWIIGLVAALLIVRDGRARWKSENETNNVLKTKGYHLEHNFGHGEQFLANFMTTLNLLAFLFHTLLELLDEVQRHSPIGCPTEASPVLVPVQPKTWDEWPSERNMSGRLPATKRSGRRANANVPGQLSISSTMKEK